MKIERFDHVHVKAPDYGRFKADFEKFMGHEFFMAMDMTDAYGTEVIYEPFPIGVEAFRPTDTAKSLSAQIAGAAAVGIFSIAFKVASLSEAEAEMEAMGCKKLEHYDNGPIQEALFDTKAKFGFYMELIEYPFESLRALAGE